jgi:hypothetical protein
LIKFGQIFIPSDELYGQGVDSLCSPMLKIPPQTHAIQGVQVIIVVNTALVIGMRMLQDGMHKRMLIIIAIVKAQRKAAGLSATRPFHQACALRTVIAIIITANALMIRIDFTTRTSP